MKYMYKVIHNGSVISSNLENWLGTKVRRTNS